VCLCSGYIVDGLTWTHGKWYNACLQEAHLTYSLCKTHHSLSAWGALASTQHSTERGHQQKHKSVPLNRPHTRSLFMAWELKRVVRVTLFTWAVTVSPGWLFCCSLILFVHVWVSNHKRPGYWFWGYVYTLVSWQIHRELASKEDWLTVSPSQGSCKHSKHVPRA
jgi:hypothetical protein